VQQDRLAWPGRRLAQLAPACVRPVTHRAATKAGPCAVTRACGCARASPRCSRCWRGSAARRWRCAGALLLCCQWFPMSSAAGTGCCMSPPVPPVSRCMCRRRLRPSLRQQPRASQGAPVTPATPRALTHCLSLAVPGAGRCQHAGRTASHKPLRRKGQPARSRVWLRQRADRRAR